MSDIVISVDISLVSFKDWMLSSYIASSIVNEASGLPLVKNNELGVDQEDYFLSLLAEASKEILKLISPRQGNCTGTLFQQTSTSITYSFAEGIPPIPQSNSIKQQLSEDVKNAICLYILFNFLQSKGNERAVAAFEKYKKLLMDIDVALYRLHD